MVVLILSNFVCAQNYNYKYISTKDGLPSSTITGITKDKNGVIWIGTEKGLCYISNGAIHQFKGLPDEGVLSVFAGSDGSLWVGLGIKQFLVRIKNGKVTPYSKEQKAIKNGTVLGFYENNKHIYLAQNDGVTVISPDGKFKPLVNKMKSDTMMSYWTVDFFKFNKKVYATSVIRGVNEVIIRKNDVVFKNVYKGEFLYGSTCLKNNLILSFDPNAKLFDADKFLSNQDQSPIKTVSSRLPASYVKDKNNNIYGGCYNINYGIHGLVKLDTNFNEELLLPENIPGQELYYDEANNEVYFGTGYGVYIVNASLYAKYFHVKTEESEKPIIASFPEKSGVVALTEGGLIQFDSKNAVQKKISVNDMAAFANKSKSKGTKLFQNLFSNQWENVTFKGIQLDDLKLINDKWIVFSRIGFFIIKKHFVIEDFVPIPASMFSYTKNGELLFDQYRLSLICLENKPSHNILYDCFRQDKIVIKHILGIERFGEKAIVISENQGVYSYSNGAIHRLKLKGLNTDVYRSSTFRKRYLVISTVNGELLFYDSKKNFQLVKTIIKSSFYNESIIDLKGNEKYLVFITSKRVFIWDGKTLKSYNEYQNGEDNFNRLNLNGNALVIQSIKTIIRIELDKMLHEIDKKVVFNVTNRFTKTNEPIFNSSGKLAVKNNAVTLQFLSYNELNTEVIKAYYRLAGNDWIEIEPSGKIYIQNIAYGDTKIEFKVTDKRSGRTSWQHAYFLINPTPWYLHFIAISLYLILFSAGLIFVTRHFVIKSKKKEIESLTIRNRLNELQMEALQSQMNPHFVFNALNSVQKFILNIDQEKALLFLNQFTVLIRKVLDYSSTKLISIEEELEFLNLYIGIENQRFQNIIHIERNIKCDEEIMIPPLLIQPLIENAIIYGSRNEMGKMFIYFSILQEEKNLRIEVKNEINTQVIKNHSFRSKSTEIIQKRLAIFDSNASMNYTVDHNFFITTILLPIYE